MKKKNYGLFNKLPFAAAAVCLVLFFYGFNNSNNVIPKVSQVDNSTSQIKPLAAKINSIKNSGKTFNEKNIFSLNSS